MPNLLSRITAPFRRRSYQAAAGGRRGKGMQSMHAPVQQAHAARATVAARARWAVANNPLAEAATKAWVAQAIGAGIKPSSLHTDPGIRAKLNAEFLAWTDVADADGRTDYYGIQAALFRSMFIAGEGLAVMINTDAGLRIRVLDPEQLDASHTATLANGHRVVQGVEFDPAGVRVGYHVFSDPQGYQLGVVRDRKRIDAADVIHCFTAQWPGQVRGISAFAPALARMGDLDGWADAMLVKLRTASLLTGFVTMADGTGAPFEGEQNGSTLTGGLEPGTIKFLEAGQEIQFSPAAQIGSEAIQFSSVIERHIAASLGLPAHAFGDVTAANYSSLKTAQAAWRARVEQIQWSTFIPQVCGPIWRRWIATTVLSGKVETTVAEALPVKHHVPSWPSLEPVKETTADIARLRAGLTSHRAILAAQGEDAEQVFREIAEDNAVAAGLGLAFPALAASNDDTPPAADDAA